MDDILRAREGRDRNSKACSRFVCNIFLEMRRTVSFAFRCIVFACLNRTGEALPDHLLKRSFERGKADERRNVDISISALLPYNTTTHVR